MRFDEDVLLSALRGMARARRLAADSSALICLEKLGLIDVASRHWRLATIAEVMAEWRRGSPGAPELEALAAIPDPGYAPLATDRKLVWQATRLRLPLLSEDRRILRAAEESGLAGWCCLWLVAGLDQAGVLGRSLSLAARERLAGEFRYDALRLGFFDQMLVCIDKGEA